MLGHALEEAGISYAVGGALANNVWGIPRATRTLDMNVFIGADEEAKLLNLARGIPITSEFY